MNMDGTWYIGRVDTTVVPWWVQRGFDIRKTIHAVEMTIDLNLRIRRGPFGWLARRWLQDNQIEWSASYNRTGEWEYERGVVGVSS